MPAKTIGRPARVMRRRAARERRKSSAGSKLRARDDHRRAPRAAGSPRGPHNCCAQFAVLARAGETCARPELRALPRPLGGPRRAARGAGAPPWRVPEGPLGAGAPLPAGPPACTWDRRKEQQRRRPERTHRKSSGRLRERERESLSNLATLEAIPLVSARVPRSGAHKRRPAQSSAAKIKPTTRSKQAREQASK